jgi:hypothetical protein
MSDRELTNKGATKVTIADTLSDAANDIRGYIEDDGLEAYYGLAPDILGNYTLASLASQFQITSSK